MADRDIEDVTRDDDDEGRKPDRSGSDDPDHQQALDRLQLSAEAFDEQGKRELEALQFQVPDLHWKKGDRDARKGMTIDDITLPDRPTVSIPKIDQSIQLVLNQERSAHLGVTVHPIDEDATDETAEVQTGLYRFIERESRAGLARSWAFERGVKAGRGWWKIVTERAATWAKTRDQDIKIKRVLYQEAIYPDPWALEPDWCDGRWLLELEWMQWSEYKKVYQKIKPRPKWYPGMGEEQAAATDIPSVLAQMNDGDLIKLMDVSPNWIRGEGEGRAVLVANYYVVEDRPDEDDKAAAKGWREGEHRRCFVRKMNAVEWMDYTIVHSAYIPFVPAIGRELIPFDSERRWMGMYEPNADGQRMFNYSASTAVEAMASEPNNPWMLAEGQEEGHEREFLLANVRRFPYVRYKPKTVGQELAPPPTRTQIDTTKLGMSMQMLSMAGEFIHAGTSMFEPSLGQQSPNVRTKGATLALQQQSEQSNSHWLDNQAELSMTLEAKIILSMLPFYYDRPGRVQRILGTEPKDEKTVILNAPFQMQGKRPVALPNVTPEEQAAAKQMVEDPQHPAKQYNLLKGMYGSVVSIGKGYKSRVDQGADELGQLFQAAPELFHLLGDIYMRFRDFPGHEEAAKRMQKMLPQQLQPEGDENDPAVLSQKLGQAMQMLQKMGEQMKEWQPIVESKVLESKTKIQVEQMNADKDLALAIMDHATKIDVAKISAAKGGLSDPASAARDEAIALGMQHAFDADQAERDRQHELAMAAAGSTADEQRAQADHERALEAGAVEHQQAGEQAAQAAGYEAGSQQTQAGIDAAAADQAQGHTLEAAQQQAELAPPASEE